MELEVHYIISEIKLDKRYEACIHAMCISILAVRG
jgi:hypothetical protein